MNKKKIAFLILTYLIISCGHKKMGNQFLTWNKFVDNLSTEMNLANDVYERMANDGIKNNCLTIMDFTFISNNKESLTELGEYLTKHYSYKVEKVIRNNDLWEINGKTYAIPITSDNLLYWVLDMNKRGYEFDAQLDSYGGLSHPKKREFPDLDTSKADYYFSKGIECYDKGDLCGAFCNWSLTIDLHPNDPNAYYSRAIVKNELYTWKSALRDYDKAIEIAPDFVSALLNRGSLKDENDDFNGAIKDYDIILTLKKLGKEDLQKTYFNRGNSKFNLKDKIGACKDWKKAFELGATYAKQRIDENCK